MTRAQGPFDVVHVIDSLGRSGGAEQQLIANLRRFDDQRLRHRILCLYQDEGDSRHRDVPEGVEVGYLFPEGRRSRNRLSVMAQVYTHMRRRNPDLIHCALPDAPLAARVAGRLLGIPVVETVVNISHEPLRTLDNTAVTPFKLAAHRVVDLLTMRWVTRFQALSKAVRDSWIDRVSLPPERIVVIPRGVDVSEQIPTQRRGQVRAEVLAELGIPGDAFVILNIGRRVAQKGQIYLIQAMPSILGSIPSTVLLSAGSRGGAATTLEMEADRLGLGETVRWLEIRDDIPRLLAAADAFVFPSLYEGLGVSVLEAIAGGLACVTADRPPMTEVVSNDVTVFSFRHAIQEPSLRRLSA